MSECGRTGSSSPQTLRVVALAEDTLGPADRELKASPACSCDEAKKVSPRSKPRVDSDALERDSAALRIVGLDSADMTSGV